MPGFASHVLLAQLPMPAQLYYIIVHQSTANKLLVSVNLPAQESVEATCSKWTCSIMQQNLQHYNMQSYAISNPVYEYTPRAEAAVQAGVQQPGCTRPHAWTAEPHTAIKIHGSDPAESYLQALLPTQPKLLKRLRWSFWSTNLLILAHVMLTGYVDPLPTTQQTLLILITCLQVIMLVLIILSFFVLTSQTLYVRLSKYDRYLREFRLLAITSLAELLLMLAAKGYFIVLVLQHTGHASIWYQQGYTALWAVQRMGLCVFWVVAAYSTFQALDYKHYDPDYLMQ